MESEDASMPRWTDDDITQMQWKLSEDYPLEPPVPEGTAFYYAKATW